MMAKGFGKGVCFLLVEDDGAEEEENKELRMTAETLLDFVCDVNRENKMLRERLEAAKYLIEGLQGKLEVARRRVDGSGVKGPWEDYNGF